MQPNTTRFEFSAKPYHHSTSPEMTVWTFVSLPRELSAKIRAHYKWMEEGWGRLKITAKTGGSE